MAAVRPPFSDKWIRDVILAPGALAGLNDQARAILLVILNTGLRPSEVAGLSAPEIRLQVNIPHLSLAPIGRHLKSNNAQRVVPLLGVSLDAMRAFPEGFDRYRGSSASLIGTVNKYMRENGLMETPQHSLYGLRHSFEDRMLAGKVDERIRRDLMGHSLGRERYLPFSASGGALLFHLLSKLYERTSVTRRGSAVPQDRPGLQSGRLQRRALCQVQRKHPI